MCEYGHCALLENVHIPFNLISSFKGQRQWKGGKKKLQREGHKRSTRKWEFISLCKLCSQYFPVSYVFLRFEVLSVRLGQQTLLTLRMALICSPALPQPSFLQGLYCRKGWGFSWQIKRPGLDFIVLRRNCKRGIYDQWGWGRPATFQSSWSLVMFTDCQRAENRHMQV